MNSYLIRLLLFGTLLFANIAFATDKICPDSQSLLTGGPITAPLSELEQLAQSAGQTVAITTSPNDYTVQIQFRDSSGAQTGELKLERHAVSQAKIQAFRLPRLKSNGGASVKPELILKEALIEFAKRAEALGFSELALESFNDWPKGNIVLDSLGFSRDGPNGLATKTLSTPSRADLITTKEAKTTYFKELARVLEAKKAEIESLLSEVNSPEGIRFEYDQALDALKNAEHIELHNLQSSQTLNNVAVYASTNVPLYTLVVHGLIPHSISRNVWFRTPERTRELYTKLFETLAGALPPNALNGLHLLTNSRDVQYDRFRNTHVLGLNQKGKFVKDPAEMVIFVGSPDTARTILGQIQHKFSDIKDDTRAFKQVFLGYGAGMNPMVVTSEARSNLHTAINATVENARFNCSQDCSVPKLYLVHSSIASDFKNGVLTRIHETEQAEPKPLTMTKDFERLIAYRQKYEKYLVNKDAILDAERKVVTPHVFVFPVEEVEGNELQEHFAPFIPIFIYERSEQLVRVARDERIQRQAMFAEIFGGTSASAELTEAKRIFQEQGHLVWINRNLFSMESANMPFGGAGVETSMVYTTEKRPRAPPFQTRGHFPTLFSQEAAHAFARPNQQAQSPSSPPSYFEGKLSELLNVSQNPATRPPENAWSNARPQFDLTRPRGLDVIRSMAREKGLSLVLGLIRPYYSRKSGAPDPWFGLPLHYPSDGNGRPLKIQGVVLHPQEIGADMRVINEARGDLNPNDGAGYLMSYLADNKLIEYESAEAIWPGIMARTESYAQLRDNGKIAADIEVERLALLTELNLVLRNRGASLRSLDSRTNLEDRLLTFVDRYFAEVRRNFPEGAFFKNFHEFATGDLGNQITTFNTSTKEIVGEFMRRLETLTSQGRQRVALDSPEFLNILNLADREMGARFIQKLLADPNDLIIQKRAILARTELGYPLEVRVDFLHGESVTGRPRFNAEYQPEAVEQAKEVINEFFRKAPPEFKFLCGGADVARLADGSWIIIEFNYGVTSGTLVPGYYPIESHQYFSNLQSRPTPFLASLESTYQEGIDAQRARLKKLQFERALWWRRGPQDLAVEDIARYFRDRMLEDWNSRGAKTEEVPAVENHLETLLEGYTSEPIARIKESARHYMRRVMRHSPQ